MVADRGYPSTSAAIQFIEGAGPVDLTPSANSSAPSYLPTLHSNRILLRQPGPADLTARLEVPPNSELHRMYGGSGEPATQTPATVETGLAEISRQDPSKTRLFIIAAREWPDGRPIDAPDGRYIGMTGLTILSWADRRARLRIGIYDRRFWSRGYGSEAIRLLLAYGFETLGLHRIDLRVLAYNHRAIRSYEKCGFQREGLERQSALVDGAWYDDVMMSILEDEYRASLGERRDRC